MVGPAAAAPPRDAAHSDDGVDVDDADNDSLTEISDLSLSDVDVAASEASAARPPSRGGGGGGVVRRPAGRSGACAAAPAPVEAVGGHVAADSPPGPAVGGRGSTLAKYVQRFRYAPPTSRDTRQRLRAAQMDRDEFWWKENGRGRGVEGRGQPLRRTSQHTPLAPLQPEGPRAAAAAPASPMEQPPRAPQPAMDISPATVDSENVSGGVLDAL